MSSNVDDELDEIIPCTSACGINADQADGFGFCTCGAEKDRQKVQSLISEQVRLARLDELNRKLSFEIDEDNANKPDYAAGYVNALEQLEAYRDRRIAELERHE